MTEIIVALDCQPREAAKIAGRLDPNKCLMKVGYELYLEDQTIVDDLARGWGYKVFLDLKLFDTPNTVTRAIAMITDTMAWGTTIHTMGGEDMMVAAHEAREKYRPDLKLFGVTILTSMTGCEPLYHLNSQSDADELVYSLTQDAHRCSFDGVVCSALEVVDVKDTGTDLLTVCPGIRLEGDTNDDQKRVVTPDLANSFGSDFIVIGRSITNSKDPAKTLDTIYDSINRFCHNN